MLVNIYLFVLVFALCYCDVEVTYKLYTVESGINNPTTISINNFGNCVYAQRTYKILCHGWTDNSSVSWYRRTIEEYLKTKRVNVITADYGKAVNSIIYLSAVWNVKAIGEYIGQLCISLNVLKDVRFDNFHIIGHSLGAHIAAIAGETVLGKTGNKLGRITGLDPAAPLFIKEATQNRITEDDGVFVDVIHSSNVIAFSIPIGQVDFYPNGGCEHPGCKKGDNSCSHNIATIFFYESILNYNFVSTKCDDYQTFLDKQCSGGDTILMGDGAKIGSTGKYYLSTSSKLGDEYYSEPSRYT